VRDHVRVDRQSPGKHIYAASQMTFGGVEIVPFAVDVSQAHVVGRAVERTLQSVPSSRRHLGRFLVGRGGRPEAPLQRPQPREEVDAPEQHNLGAGGMERGRHLLQRAFVCGRHIATHLIG
jgi:hypothetical protein